MSIPRTYLRLSFENNTNAATATAHNHQLDIKNIQDAVNFRNNQRLITAC